MTRFDPHRMPLAGRAVRGQRRHWKNLRSGFPVLRAVLGQQAPHALDGPALRIDEILMVTFTRAATAELRDRLGQRLRSALQAFLDPEPPKDAFLLSYGTKVPIAFGIRRGSGRSSGSSGRGPGVHHSRLLPSRPSRRRSGAGHALYF